jgi:hypothetical protein
MLEMTVEDLVSEPELRAQANAALEQYKNGLERFTTYKQRYNVSRCIQGVLEETTGQWLRDYTQAVLNGKADRANHFMEKMLMVNALGKAFTDYSNTTIRPEAIKEEKAADEAKMAAMTPAQKEQYKKAKENPFVKFMGADPASMVDEPGAGGSFDA